MTELKASQVSPEVPIWDLFCNGEDVGLLTDFPGEGPMATVRMNGVKCTFSGDTRHAVLEAAKTCILDQGAVAQEFEDEHIEDEDGSEAFVLWLERRAEDRAYPYDEPPF